MEGKQRCDGLCVYSSHRCDDPAHQSRVTQRKYNLLEKALEMATERLDYLRPDS